MKAFEYKASRGDSEPYKASAWHVLMPLTIGPAILLLVLAAWLAQLVDLLLMDTHHITFTCLPKKPRSG